MMVQLISISKGGLWSLMGMLQWITVDEEMWFFTLNFAFIAKPVIWQVITNFCILMMQQDLWIPPD